MPASTFDRRALWLPIALPALSGLALLAVSPLERIPDWLANVVGLPAAFLLGGAFIYIVPYLITLAVVYRVVDGWSPARLKRAFFAFPGLLSLSAPAYLGLSQLVDGSPRWWDGCGTIGLVALAVAYTYALLVALLGRALATRGVASAAHSAAV